MRMETPPDWSANLDYIDRLISNSGQRRLDPYELDFATAVDEMRVLTGDARPYSSHASDSWRSCIADLRRSYEWLGVHLHCLVDIEWRSLSQAVRNLPLSSAIQMESRREGVLSLCERLRETLRSGLAVDAAWLDLVHATETRLSFPDCRKRRDIFMAVAKLRGHRLSNFGGTMRTIGGVLADSNLDVASLRYMIDDGERCVHVDRPGLAGMSQSERLSLISKYWLTDLPTPDNVVWLKYRRGLMGDFDQTVGQVTFFRADWLADAIQHDEEHQSVRLPDEIRRHRAEFDMFLRSPIEHGDVVARVQVGRGLESSARRRAELAAESVLAASVGIVGRVGWNLTGTSVHLADDEVIGGSWGALERAKHRFWDYEPPLDVSSVNDWVGIYPSRIVLTDELEWTLDSIKAVSASVDSSPSARLAVAVQAIERVDATTVQLGSWSEFVVQILASRWIAQEMINELENAILFAASSEARFLAPGVAKASAKPVRDAIGVSAWDRLSGQTLGEALKSNAINLLGILDPGSMAYGRLAWHSRVFSLSKARPHLRGSRSNFEHFVACTRRYRNAAVHGGPQSADVIEWCGDLTERIAAVALSWKLVAHLRGGSAAQTIRDLAAIEDWRVDEISAGRFAAALGSPPERLRLRG